MKIIITGSESFVGKELIAECRKQNIEVFGVDAAPRGGGDYEYVQADIRDKNIAEILPEGADALVHLAALSRDPDCRGKAYECFEVNVMGSLNMMNAVAKKNIKQFIFASSEWVYDDMTGTGPKDEDSPIGAHNHTSEYAFSKLVTEINLKQRSAQGFCPATVLRFGIIYGPRPANWSAVESLMSAVKNGEEVKVGSKRTGRRFIHVSDIAQGIIKAIGLQGFNILNLTGDRIITLGDIIEASEKVLGVKAKVAESNPDKPSVRDILNSRAKKALGWEPLMDLESGLRTLVPFV